MNEDTRRLFFAMFVGMAVLVGYQLIVNWLAPPPERPPSQAPATSTPGPSQPAGAPDAQGVSDTPTQPPATQPPAGRLAFEIGPAEGPITLGGIDGHALRMKLDVRGAALATLELTGRDEKGRIRHRTAPDQDEPYQLLYPVADAQAEYLSYATHRVWIEEHGTEGWRLDDLRWRIASQADDSVTFATTLRSDAGGEVLRLTKTYTLRPGQPVFDLVLNIENAGPAPLTVRIEQDGPAGIRRENQQYEMRTLLTTQRIDNRIELNKARQYDELRKATVGGDPLQLLRVGEGPFVWTALANKYFAAYTRPLPCDDAGPDFVTGVRGLVLAPGVPSVPGDLLVHGDLLARMILRPTVVEPGSSVRFPFEVYAGPKDQDHLRRANPAYVDTTQLYYQLAQSADTRYCCSFCAPDWLRELMVWLLHQIYLAVRNYGVAIIVLVVLIRTLLHPLTVFQQKSMYRMQESMSRIQPMLAAIDAKYPNDRMKAQQEKVELFKEQGVNPAGSIVSFLPLMLQMPILIALWTALNTDVYLRHAAFDPWWIRDLAAPDAFLTFDPPVNVPILSLIPWVGSWFQGVTSLNLLPILMGISMWLQQKYMPKPHLKAKLEAAKSDAAKQPAAHKPRSGMSPEDQLRQQQMMAYMMAILFPIMFYRFPAGLTLYWMATNVFGICESLIIRRQLDREKLKRAVEPPKPRKPGFVGKLLHRLAERAAELQRHADEVSRSEPPRKRKGGDERKK